jgi:S-formylglutathione hydrolase FrmB
MKFVCILVTSIMLASLDAVAGGSVQTESFESPALGVRKTYHVWLPEGYGAGTQRYPVIYLLHGWGVTQDSWVSKDLDLPGAAGSIDLKAIVVMPDGDRSLYANSFAKVAYDACLADANPQRNKKEKRSEFCVKTPRYEDYIVVDLVRDVDAKYRTIARREARAVAGESAGGNGAMALALRNKQVFSAVASHSGALALLYEGPQPYEKGKARFHSRIDPNPRKKEVEDMFGLDIAEWRRHDPYSLAATLKNGELAIYVDCGSEDEAGFHDHALAFHDRLLELGIAHRFESVPGKHHDDFWKTRIGHSLKFHAEHFKASLKGLAP